MTSENATHETAELILYIENVEVLWKQLRTCEIALEKKVKKGIYKSELAPKMFVWLANQAAKRYAKEFANPSQWNKIFTPEIRREVCKELAMSFEAENNIK